MRRIVDTLLIVLVWFCVGCGGAQDTGAAWKALHAACRIVDSWELQ